MPERKAHFRFITDAKVVVSTKRALAKLAGVHLADAASFANRAALRVRELQPYLLRLQDMEVRLLKRELLDDDSEEREDLRLVEEAIAAVNQARSLIENLRTRKIEAAIAFEDAVAAEERRQRDQENAKKSKKPQPPPPSLANPVAPAQAAPAPASPTLQLPTELLEQALREARKREEARESRENEY